MKTFFALTAVALALAQTPARAHGGASEMSALSMLPIAVSVAAPAVVLSAGAVFSVAAVYTVAEGTVWVLERASDGLRFSVTVASMAAGGLSLAVGTVVTATALSTGWVLSAAGQAICFIPNEIGRALLHNERVTR